MKLFNFDVCRVTTHTHTPYGRTALISAYLLVLCFLCATPIQAQTTHINNITVEAGGRLHIEVRSPPTISISEFMALSDADAKTQFARKRLTLTGTAEPSYNIAALFTKLKAAQPANIILTDQTGTVPNGTTTGGATFQSWAGGDATACAWLKSFRADKMTEVAQYAFYQCTALASVSLPKATSIGNNAAFYNCIALASVSLPEATSIGSSTFASCSNLASVSLPEATYIGVNAFNGCSQLTSVSLPKAKTIGTSAFNGCSILSSVSLPEATTIENNVFQYCAKLTDISFGANITFYGTNVFASVPTNTQTTLHLLNATEFGNANGNTWQGYIFKAILAN